MEARRADLLRMELEDLEEAAAGGGDPGWVQRVNKY